MAELEIIDGDGRAAAADPANFPLQGSHAATRELMDAMRALADGAYEDRKQRIGNAWRD
jgi:hypothetical protein